MEVFKTSCRICLEDGAIYPIFESDEEFESVYAKLAACIREKLQDIEEFPRYICLKCKNTSDTICSFMAKFEKTCEILNSKILHVKNEPNEDIIDLNDNEADLEPFKYELQLDDLKPKATPKAEKRNPAEILESLSHLTVKRIKVETISDNDDNFYEDEVEVETNSDVKKKKGRPKKVGTKKGRPKVSKKAVSEPYIENNAKTKPPEKIKSTETTKAATKPRATKNGAKKPSADPSKPDAAKSKKNDRTMDLDTDKQENKEKPIDKTFLCDICGETYKDKKYLQDHISKKHRERRFKCTKCPKAYFTADDLNDHKIRHDNIRPYVCDTCGKRFNLKRVLVSHIKVVHKNIKRVRNVLYKCKFCDRSYTYKRGVVIHERSVHTGERPEVCQICGGSFYDIVYLREHMRIHTGDAPFKCPVCARGYTQRGNMKSHMRNHRISQLDSDTLAKIKPNYFKFMRPSHNLKMQGLSKQESKVTIKQEIKEISPPKKIEKAPKLCDKCGATFSTAEYLYRHKSFVHKEKSHKCTKCPKAFITEKRLKDHVMWKHENMRTIICDHCGKGFFTKSLLTHHMNNVHLKRKKKVVIYNCSFCEKTFKYKKGAIIHERAVHTGERPATCDVCGSSFYDELYLKEHMRLHTGDTPHKCPVCARGYAQRGNMKSHMRNHRISQLDPDMLAKIKPSYFKFMRP